MKHISVLIKPASSLCNMTCRYCFYADVVSHREVPSYGKMRPETTAKMIENIYADLNDGDHLTLAFQGGEPTIAGLRYYKHLDEMVQKQQKKVTVHYSIQTNGTLINEAWCEFLQEKQFLVGLSIDGYGEAHDSNRLDYRGDPTFARVLHTKKIFDTYEIEYNILCVLTQQLAYEPEKVFRFLIEEKIDYIQFIPCLDDLDAQAYSEFALTPAGFAHFYERLFEMWLAELEAGHYISIKLFDDIVNLFVRRQVTACGILGNCSIQYVIEGDGSVYPCDFYCLDDYKLGNITEQTLRELFNQQPAKAFLNCQKELPSYCDACPFKALCHGGCRRMKDAMYVNDENNFCGYQKVLKKVVPKIGNILDGITAISESTF